jgi:hypothetical protein
MAEAFVTAEEIEKERTAEELAAWIECKIGAIAALEGGKEAIRLRRGLCKKLVEEVYAISIFATFKYSSEPLVKLLPVLGNQQYDVRVTDMRETPSRIHYLEITQAHEGEQDYLRMLELTRKGNVWASGAVVKKGTKHTGIEVTVDGSAKSMSEHMDRGTKLIKEAIERKSGGRYNSNTSLVVMFEDTIAFRDEQERHELDSFMRALLPQSNLEFDRLYVVGWSKQNFFEYDLR